MKIFLIGMPGSGKTTLGKRLAKEMLLPFVDLDKEIEKREGKSVQQLFAENGEDFFRQAESRELAEWAGSSKSFVMATGGGTPCFYEGIKVINQSGLSIFLETPLSTLLSRLEKKTDRPLLNAADIKEKNEKLASLLEKRNQFYNQANIIVQNADLPKVMAAIHLRK
jgi:shikimate kinase